MSLKENFRLTPGRKTWLWTRCYPQVNCALYEKGCHVFILHQSPLQKISHIHTNLLAWDGLHFPATLVIQCFKWPVKYILDLKEKDISSHLAATFGTSQQMTIPRGWCYLKPGSPKGDPETRFQMWLFICEVIPEKKYSKGVGKWSRVGKVVSYHHRCLRFNPARSAKKGSTEHTLQSPSHSRGRELWYLSTKPQWSLVGLLPGEGKFSSTSSLPCLHTQWAQLLGKVLR